MSPSVSLSTACSTFCHCSLAPPALLRPIFGRLGPAAARPPATPRTARPLGEPCRTGGLYKVGNEVAMLSCDVYVVRKQLYISEEHERTLKARARELGISEAELVRRMLDGLLLDGEGRGGLAGTDAAEALELFIEEVDRLAESHRFPEGYVFYRDELYEDRA